MKFPSALCIVLLVVIAISASGSEDPSVEKLEGSHGWINWERQVVKAVGHGVLPGDAANEAQAALMARSAAVADAYRNLASTVFGVRVTGDTYVKNFVTESDEIRLRVEGFIRGAQVVSDKQLPDRSYEIILQLPMTGETGLISGLGSDVLPDKKVQPSTGEGPTGLIIDARGLDLKTAISPRILDENGAEVYGKVAVSPEFAIEVGIVAYPRDLTQARKSPRTGEHPLVIKALRRSPKSATDVVISNSDAERVRAAEKSSGILSRCAVSIVTSPAPKQPARKETPVSGEQQPTAG